VVWGRRPGSVVVVVTGTDVVVVLAGTLDAPEPGRTGFDCEVGAEAVLPHATRRVIATIPRMAWANALNRADAGFDGRVRFDWSAPTTLSVVFVGAKRSPRSSGRRRSFARAFTVPE